jgi:hypothetical protein
VCNSFLKKHLLPEAAMNFAAKRDKMKEEGTFMMMITVH